MRLGEILTEDVKLPKKPKARPKKTLWYTHPGFWKNDLDLTRAGYVLHQEENEETIFASDPDKKHCFGVWHPKKLSGVTFATPRPFHSAVHPRHKLKPFSYS